jgi:hypothetical protein
MYAFTAIALAATRQAAGPDGEGRPTAFAELLIVMESVEMCLPSGVATVDVVLGGISPSHGDRPVPAG